LAARREWKQWQNIDDFFNPNLSQQKKNASKNINQHLFNLENMNLNST